MSHWYRFRVGAHWSNWIFTASDDSLERQEESESHEVSFSEKNPNFPLEDEADLKMWEAEGGAVEDS